jgi:hypothetical protein
VVDAFIGAWEEIATIRSYYHERRWVNAQPHVRERDAA